MVNMNYSPFTDSKGNAKTIFDLKFADLNQLKEKQIEEGPYVEYKREFSPSVKKKVPNIITSFANERGGWFFIGIDENNIDVTCIEKADYELMISNMLKDNSSPIPRTVTRFLVSDDDSNKGVVVIWIPEGDNPPYISKGNVYRRVGSGSSPVEDRYYLDRLYEKASDNRKNLSGFCKKEISIENRVWNRMVSKYHEYGMCNIYLIPVFNINIMDYDQGGSSKFVDLALKISDELHIYPLSNESNVSFRVPMEKVSYSHESIVFRSSRMLANYETTVAWEQFLDGKAKFHIPLPYLNKQQCIESIEQDVMNPNDKEILKDFDFVYGRSLIASLLGCLSNYFRTMRSINDSFQDVIIAVEFNHVRKDVLYFDTPFFSQSIRENGLVFSDRGYYFFNKQFEPVKVLKDDVYSLFAPIGTMFNAFGWSTLNGVRLFTEVASSKQ